MILYIITTVAVVITSKYTLSLFLLLFMGPTALFDTIYGLHYIIQLIF